MQPARTSSISSAGIAGHSDAGQCRNGTSGAIARSMALATKLGMRPLTAHCHVGLSKLYRRTGHREQAQEHLATATTIYREMDMRFWLEGEEAEMRALRVSRCPQCQHDNPGDAKFCLECGLRLALKCLTCGTELPSGAKFCKECGQAVAGPALSPPARFGNPDSYTPKHLAERILTSKAALEGECGS